MGQTDTLCGWDDQKRVDYFVTRGELLIPKRYEQLSSLIDFFPWPTDQPIRVLDLGAGYGAVTETILTRYPQASVVWLDGSTAMQGHAEPRLAKYGQQVCMFLRDLADPAWSAELPGPFHAAVSAIALHHLTDQRKRALCAEVYELLLPGGMFLNNDVVSGAPDMREHFTPLSDRVVQQHLRERTGVEHSLEEIRQARTAMQRPKGQSSHIAPLEPQLEWWREAGFQMVDCYWKFLNFAIFGGMKGELLLVAGRRGESQREKPNRNSAPRLLPSAFCFLPGNGQHGAHHPNPRYPAHDRPGRRWRWCDKPLPTCWPSRARRARGPGSRHPLQSGRPKRFPGLKRLSSRSRLPEAAAALRPSRLSGRHWLGSARTKRS